MKNFLNYLAENQKTYEFRVKIANFDPNERMDQIKSALEAYAVESVSTPKRLPIMESDIDFPNIQNCQIYLLDAVLKYPCNNDQVRAVIAERANIPAANVFVVPKNHPEELWRWNESGDSDLREFKQGESVLDKPYEDNPAAKKAGDDYASFNSILKELSTPKEDIAEGKDDTPESNNGKTTNELPQGTASPVGSKQNKIPSAIKGQK
jgi:hypothetical protein